MLPTIGHEKFTHFVEAVDDPKDVIMVGVSTTNRIS